MRAVVAGLVVACVGLCGVGALANGGAANERLVTCPFGGIEVTAPNGQSAYTAASGTARLVIEASRVPGYATCYLEDVEISIRRFALPTQGDRTSAPSRRTVPDFVITDERFRVNHGAVNLKTGEFFVYVHLVLPITGGAGAVSRTVHLAVHLHGTLPSSDLGFSIWADGKVIGGSLAGMRILWRPRCWDP